MDYKITRDSLLTDDEIGRWWYGSWGDNPDRREIIREGLSQLAADFDTGHTIKSILKDLGLVSRGRKSRLLKKGRRYLYYANETAIHEGNQK